jgi:hypothetical protein
VDPPEWVDDTTGAGIQLREEDERPSAAGARIGRGASICIDMDRIGGKQSQGSIVIGTSKEGLTSGARTRFSKPGGGAGYSNRVRNALKGSEEDVVTECV